MTGTEQGGTQQDQPAVTLTPSGLGQYISYSGCPRFFRFRYFDQDIVNERNWYNPNRHSDLFSELGLAYEEQQLETLASEAHHVIGDQDSDGEHVSFDATWELVMTRRTSHEPILKRSGPEPSKINCPS